MSPRAFRAPFVGLLMLTLAACGGTAAPSSTPASSSASASKPASASASAPVASGASTSASAAASSSAAASGASAATGPIKIGFDTSLTGPFSLLGTSMDNGFKLYLSEVGNKAGGRDIQVITEDEATDPKAGLDKAKKLVEQDKVDILAGLVLTPSLYAVRDYIEAAPRKVILVCTNAGGSDLDTTKKSNYVVRVSFSNAQANIPMGPYVYNTLGARKVFVSASDFAAGPEKIDPFKKGFIAAGGQIVGEVKPPLGTSDFAPFLSKFIPSGADASYNFYAGSDAIRFVQQYTQFGIKQKVKLMGAGDIIDDTVLPAEGTSAVGAITSLHYYTTVDTPENKKFLAAYKAKYGKDANTYAMQAYDGAHLIVDALNATKGNTDPAALLKAMQGHKWNSPRGPVSISPEYNDIVQNIYVAETKEVNGKVTNVITHTFEAVQPAETK